MGDLEPSDRKTLFTSNLLGLAATGLLLLGATTRASWSFVATGAASILLGADFICSRRLAMLGWGPAARERVTPFLWHRWVAGVALIVGGCWIVVTGLAD